MTKDYISPKGEKALIQVAEWLEAGAPHVDVNGRKIDHFNMESIVDQNNSCGTSCCIAGAVMQFNRLSLKGSEEDEWWFMKGRDKVAKYLQISRYNADELFSPWNQGEGFTLSRDFQDYSNPAVAAKVVRHFVDTGVVDWEKFM